MSRRSLGAALGAVAVVALVALLATGAWFTRQLRGELRAAELARQQAAAAEAALRVRLVRSTAQGIDSDLRHLTGVARGMAFALAGRADWSEQQLTAWLSAELDTVRDIFGMAVAFEPRQFSADVEDYCLYVYRGKGGLEAKQLVPPEYTPNYRQWEWYAAAADTGSWSEPYVDDGGGEIPMVTFSMPFQRDGRRAGVVTVDLSLEYFEALQRSLGESNAGGDAHAFVATRAGTVLSHPQSQFRFPAKDSRGAAKPTLDAFGDAQDVAHGVDLATGKSAELIAAPIEAANWIMVGVVPD